MSARRSAGREGAETSGPPGAGGEETVTVQLRNRYGLHMRPAKQVVELANSFPCEIDLLAKGQEVDAKSILGIIGLGAECGDRVTVRARGAMAEEAARAVGEFLAALPELHGEPADAPCPEESEDDLPGREELT